EPQYEKVRGFQNGLAPVYKDKKWGYINLEGKWVIEPQFRDAEVFSKDGLAPVKEKKLWGFINKQGELIIPYEYVISATNFNFFESSDKGFVQGLARVKSSKGWTFINTKGEPLGGKWYKNLENFN